MAAPSVPDVGRVPWDVPTRYRGCIPDRCGQGEAGPLRSTHSVSQVDRHAIAVSNVLSERSRDGGGILWRRVHNTTPPAW